MTRLFLVFFLCSLLPAFLAYKANAFDPGSGMGESRERWDEITAERNRGMEEGESGNNQHSWSVRKVALAHTGAYSLVIAGLDRLWYQDYPRSSFHFQDDLGHWKQMDKLGHLAATYHLSRIGAWSFRAAGARRKEAAFYGAISGTALLTAVEVLDGFSTQWGFSPSDMAANILGTALFLGQELAWEEQKIHLKYSYRSNSLHAFRPGLLGDKLPERLLKDYNGMTMWLSFNLNALFDRASWAPPWLNLAIGHGASGMLGASHNPEKINGQELPVLVRHRQWYLSADVDLARIQTDSPLLSGILKGLNFVKIPLPGIQYNRVDGWIFHLAAF